MAKNQKGEEAARVGIRAVSDNLTVWQSDKQIQK